MKLTMKKVTAPTTKVKANWTQEMVDDLSKMSGINIVSKMENTLLEEIQKEIEREERKKIYDRRKRIIDKLLK